MITLSIFGPCEIVRTLLVGNNTEGWDCEQRLSPAGFVLFILVLLGLGVFFELVHRGRIPWAKPVTKWLSTLEKKRFVEVELLELCAIGLPIGLILCLGFVILDGPSTWNLLFIPLPVLLLFLLQVGAAKEETDPHKDIPREVRNKTTEELKAYNERLAALNQTRSLMGEPQSHVSEKVDKLQSLEQMKAELKAKYPDMKKDIDLLIEMERIRELEKNK